MNGERELPYLGVQDRDALRDSGVQTLCGLNSNAAHKPSGIHFYLYFFNSSFIVSVLDDDSNVIEYT
jgi:hypothetical protein